jgi:GTPase-activator protein for Ras-like GTPase
LRTVFANLQRNVAYKFGDQKIRYSVVTGLLFSRLFCVALLSPKLFGLALGIVHHFLSFSFLFLCADHPDSKTERTLKLVVKVIQNVANLVLVCSSPFLLHPRTR